MIEQIVWGLILSGAVSVIAYTKRSLTLSGALAAVGIGTVMYGFGSLFWFGLLLVFFISSSLLSHYKKTQKYHVEEQFAKTGRRDALQVLANGGIGAFLVIAAYLIDDDWQVMAVYVGIMATVNADTWGTEWGVLSKQKPRHILTWKVVEKGTSGGLSTLGTLATVLGALCIGVFASFFQWIAGETFSFTWILIGLLSGVLGAFFDSLLGATIQVMYRCPSCQKETEKRMHCGLPTKCIRGYAWMNNDVVNAWSSLVGGTAAWLMWGMIP